MQIKVPEVIDALIAENPNQREFWIDDSVYSTFAQEITPVKSLLVGNKYYHAIPYKGSFFMKASDKEGKHDKRA